MCCPATKNPLQLHNQKLIRTVYSSVLRPFVACIPVTRFNFWLCTNHMCSYTQQLAVFGLQSAFHHFGLALGVLALVREEVGLDVGVREPTLVCGSQSPGLFHMYQQLAILVVHSKQNLPGDGIVSLARPCLTVGAQVTGEAADTAIPSKPLQERIIRVEFP